MQTLLEPFLLWPLDACVYAQMELHLELLLRWNARTNLTSIRDRDEMVRRHFGESVFLAQHLDAAAGEFLRGETLPGQIFKGKTLLDLGSGAGFPGIPIQMVHPELQVMLAESQGKKAAFLQEARRVLNLPNLRVHAGRAEVLLETSPPAVFDFVAMRAVDNPAESLETAVRLLAEGGTLATLVGSAAAAAIVSGHAGFDWQQHRVPESRERVLLIGGMC